MSGKRPFRWRSARFVLFSGMAAYVGAAAALVLVQGIDVVPSRACVVPVWAPLRGLPWVLVALLPTLVYLVVAALAKLRREAPPSLGGGPYRASLLGVPPRIDRPRSHVRLRALLIVLALAAGVAESRRSSCPYAVPASCHPKASRIRMMGVGEIDPVVIDDLAKHFRDCYGLPVVVAPPMAAPAVAWNAKRQQWTAEILLGMMPGCSDESAPCDLVIGITSEEIYTTQEDWRYAFTIRDPERHVAIVSTARMTSLAFGTWNDRLRKVVAKTIALQYCGLPQSDDPRSVRYKRIMGPANLDEIDEARW